MCVCVYIYIYIFTHIHTFTYDSSSSTTTTTTTTTNNHNPAVVPGRPPERANGVSPRLATATCHLIMHRKPNGKLHSIYLV